MKKIIVGIIAASILVSCVEDDIIIKKEHEKTKIEKSLLKNNQENRKSTDTIRSEQPQTAPIKDLDPGTSTDPGGSLDPGGSFDPGEVGPIVTTPPK